jgi:hypothetical protein
MVGAEGFMFVYFHHRSRGIRALLLCNVFLTCDWSALVGSVIFLIVVLYVMIVCDLTGRYQHFEVGMETVC